MASPAGSERARGLPTESYGRVLANLAGVMLVLVAIATSALWRREAHPKPVPAAAPLVATTEAPRLKPKARPAADPEPLAPRLDREAVARGEAELAAARADRERASKRLEQATAELGQASAESAGQALAARSLGSRLRDPSARIHRASQRAVALRAERSKIQSDLSSLANVTKPRRKSLTDRTPVAKPAEGTEYHFEVRHSRVTFLDLEKLLDRAKADAQLHIRLNEGGRPISSTVGPVGAFSMRYELVRSLTQMVDDVLDLRGPTYTFRRMEVIPEFEGRGDTFEAAMQPASDFARTINRLTPTRATITMWVYPDGSALYRKLREALHAKGFLVAARPLPEGMAIGISPFGSQSAGQ
jgi:hypothetical protein